MGHSQGGLIIVAASKVLDDPARFESLVARVALLGAPLAGTMRAADALCFGSEDLGKNEQAFARALARTWPALYQMLPSWDAILDPTDRPLPATEQLLELGGWPEAEGVTGDLLQRATELQAMLRDPFSRCGSTSAVAIMTSNKPTKLTMVRARDRAGDVFEGESYQGGDSLVPFERTRSGWSGVRRFVVHVPGNVRAHAFHGRRSAQSAIAPCRASSSPRRSGRRRGSRRSRAAAAARGRARAAPRRGRTRRSRPGRRGAAGGPRPDARGSATPAGSLGTRPSRSRARDDSVQQGIAEGEDGADPRVARGDAQRHGRAEGEAAEDEGQAGEAVLHLEERRPRVLLLAGAVVVHALAAADAPEVEAEDGEPGRLQRLRGAEDDLEVHHPAVERVRVADDRRRRRAAPPGA